MATPGLTGCGGGTGGGGRAATPSSSGGQGPGGVSRGHVCVTLSYGRRPTGLCRGAYFASSATLRNARLQSRIFIGGLRITKIRLYETAFLFQKP